MNKCDDVNKCTCPKTACKYHSDCFSCIAKHKKIDSLPHCLFSEKDKSNRNYYEILKKRFEGDNNE